MMDKKDFKQLKDLTLSRHTQQEKIIDYLKTLKITRKDDRLAILNYWNQVHKLLASTVTQWNTLLETPILLEEIDKRTLKEFYNHYKILTLDFLEFDQIFVESLHMIASAKVGKEEEEEEEKEEEPPKKEAGKFVV